MSVQQLPSKRWRAQVFDAQANTKISVSKLLSPKEMEDLGADERGTFERKNQAIAACEKALPRIEDRKKPTVKAWHKRWLSDALFIRHIGESTLVHRMERTKAFVAKHGHLLLTQVDDGVVSEWLEGGANLGTVDVLRTMFNDAMSAEAGRIIKVNPWAGISVKQSHGNKFKQPPTEKQMWHMLDRAEQLAPLSFALYVGLGCMTGMRPGQLDALMWDDVLWHRDRIEVQRQWSAKLNKITQPKTGAHDVVIVDHARVILKRAEKLRVPGVPWVFTTVRGHHYTPSTRFHHWNKVRIGAGVEDKTLYLCTRHFFGWYAYVRLRLPAEVVGAQLGHADGKLVRELYGHPDRQDWLDRVGDAFKIERPSDEPRTAAVSGDEAARHLRLVEPQAVCHGFANGCGCATCRSRGGGDVSAEPVRQPWEPVHHELAPS